MAQTPGQFSRRQHALATCAVAPWARVSMPRWPPCAAESISTHESRGPCCSRSPDEFPARCWTSRRRGSATWTGTNEGSSVHVELEQRQRVSFLEDARDFLAVRRRNVVVSARKPVAIRGVSFGSPHLLDVTHHGNSRHLHLSAAIVVRLRPVRVGGPESDWWRVTVQLPTGH